MQAMGNLRLKAIKDFTGRSSAYIQMTKQASRTGSDGQEKSVYWASSFIGSPSTGGQAKHYRVGHAAHTDNVDVAWQYADDIHRSAFIVDPDTNRRVFTKGYKVGIEDCITTFASNLGDYASNSIRYNDWGERNPMASAILGGIAGGLIEGVLDPMNLVMLGGMYGAGKVILATANATSKALKAVHTVTQTTVRVATGVFRGVMVYTGANGGYNLTVGAATGNADMVAAGTRGLTMLLPMEAVLSAGLKMVKPPKTDIP
ncbi:MAG: hypothetical protein FD126_3241, partial [Elusimicrobia bacterium]